MISQALEDANVDVANSALGLDEFKRLIGQGKKKDTAETEGEI
jgi:hypothetical protein